MDGRLFVSHRRAFLRCGGQISPNSLVISSMNERSSMDEAGEQGGGVRRLTIEYSIGVEDDELRQGHCPDDVIGLKRVKRIGTCDIIEERIDPT